LPTAISVLRRLPRTPRRPTFSATSS